MSITTFMPKTRIQYSILYSLSFFCFCNHVSKFASMYLTAIHFPIYDSLISGGVNSKPENTAVSTVSIVTSPELGPTIWDIIRFYYMDVSIKFRKGSTTVYIPIALKQLLTLMFRQRKQVGFIHTRVSKVRVIEQFGRDKLTLEQRVTSFTVTLRPYQTFTSLNVGGPEGSVPRCRINKHLLDPLVTGTAGVTRCPHVGIKTTLVTYTKTRTHEVPSIRGVPLSKFVKANPTECLTLIPESIVLSIKVAHPKLGTTGSSPCTLTFPPLDTGDSLGVQILTDTDKFPKLFCSSPKKKHISLRVVHVANRVCHHREGLTPTGSTPIKNLLFRSRKKVSLWSRVRLKDNLLGLLNVHRRWYRFRRHLGDSLCRSL